MISVFFYLQSEGCFKIDPPPEKPNFKKYALIRVKQYAKDKIFKGK